MKDKDKKPKKINKNEVESKKKIMSGTGMLLACRKNGPLFKPVFIIFICPFIYSQIICELHNFGPHFFLRYL